MPDDISESIMKLTYGMDAINKNIDNTFNITKDLSARIIALETDLKERVVRKKLYSSFYPIILIILAATLNIDHNKISNLIDNLNDLRVVDTATPNIDS